MIYVCIILYVDTAENMPPEHTENPSKRTKWSVSSGTTTTDPATTSEVQVDSSIPSSYPTPTCLNSFSAPPHIVPFTVSRCHTGTYIEPPASDPPSTTEISISWSTKLLKCVDASPLLIVWPDQQENTSLPVHLVVLGSHGGDVAAVDGRSGEAVWLLQLGEHVEAAAAFDPKSSLVFVGTFQGNDVDGFRSRRAPTAGAVATEDSSSTTGTPALGCLWALDVFTGKIHWHLTTPGEIKSTPLVVDESVFIATYDGHLYQVNCRDGALVNKYACGGSVYASPVLSADGSTVIVVTTSGNLVQFARSSEQSYLTPISTTHLVAMFSTPFTYLLPETQHQPVVVLAGTDGTLRQLALSDSEEIWCETVSATSFFSSSCFLVHENSAIIGCHDGIVRKFNVQNGTILWERRIGVAIFASPHLRKNNKECVIATVAGDVLIICVKEGTILAKQRLPAEVFSSPVCIGNLIYVGCRDNRLYCLTT